jgi:DNA gyrase subunit A
MRAVIELKRGENADVILNQLYKDTPMQDSFGINMVAIVDGQPKLCNLKDVIEAFLRHRREVITAAPYSNCARRANAAVSVARSNVDGIIAQSRPHRTAGCQRR